MNALMVRVGDVKIGVLERFEDARERFSFCDQYVSSLLGARPVLGQIFEDRFPNAISVDGPIFWFTHLLPQGVMLRWRSKLLGLDDHDTFEMLGQLGDDLPGAVYLEPCESELRPKQTVTIVRKEASETEASLFRFSLAGAQWKLSARSAGRGLTTRAMSEGTSCIAKFHSPEYPGLPQCEFATMSWARAAGLCTPEFTLRHVSDFDQIPEEMPTGDGKVFVIERFDRTHTGRVHIEDFGQILDRPPGHSQYFGSYEEIASVVHWIAPNSVAELLKTIVFHVISGNGDAHLKNFSLIYPDSRNAILTPAYDIVSTLLYLNPGKEELALTLGGQRKFDRVNHQSFSPLISRLGLEQTVGEQIVRDFTDQAIAAWQQSDIQGNYSRQQIDRMNVHLASLPFTSQEMR